MPITLGTDGKIKAVTADTVADVYGLAAENAEEGEEVVYYLTGEFFGSAIEVPVGKTAADFKAPFRKIGIFLVVDSHTANLFMYEWCKLSVSFLKIYINLLCVECFDIAEESRLNERLHFRHTLYKFPHCSRVINADICHFYLSPFLYAYYIRHGRKN